MKDETEPRLPDGIGMDVKEVASQMAMLHDTIVQKDDPVLMMVTVLNMFMTRLDRLFDLHRQEMAKVLGHEVFNCLGETKKTAESLGDVLKASSSQAIATSIAQGLGVLQNCFTGAKWCTLVIVICTAANVAAFILK